MPSDLIRGWIPVRERKRVKTKEAERLSSHPLLMPVTERGQLSDDRMLPHCEAFGGTFNEFSKT
jgi:hypothetical protein